MTIHAWEIKDGFDAVFCETLEDAQMVADEYKRRLGVINATDAVTIEECEVTDIPENERHYVEQLRKRQAGTDGGASVPGAGEGA